MKEENDSDDSNYECLFANRRVNRDDYEFDLFASRGADREI